MSNTPELLTTKEQVNDVVSLVPDRNRRVESVGVCHRRCLFDCCTFIALGLILWQWVARFADAPTRSSIVRRAFVAVVVRVWAAFVAALWADNHDAADRLNVGRIRLD
jgi:hypothetical protein